MKTHNSQHLNLALILCFGIWSLGCSSLPGKQNVVSLKGEKKLQVQFIPQQPQECGPTVLRMATAHLRPDLDFDVYRRMSFREEAHGSFKMDLLSAARRLGLAPYKVRSPQDLIHQIDSGHPVIVYQNLGLEWLPAGHYALMIGYSEGPQEVYLHSDQKPEQALSISRFYSTWKRGGSWAYVILPVDQVPANADFEETLENAMVFERLGEAELAERLYQNLAEHWPDRYEPHVGLTALYTQVGSPQKALESALSALKIAPEHPDLLYNAAFLYFERGDFEKARRLQDRAVFFSNPEMSGRYTSF